MYLQDASSISRAPTLAMAYLTIFMKLDYFDDIDKVSAFVQKYHKNSLPNTSVVKELFKQN